MKKSKILTMVTLSTLVLAQAGTAFADEVTIGSDTATEQISSGTSDSGVQVETPTDSSIDQGQDTGGTGTVIGDDSTATETPSDGGGVVVDTPTDVPINPDTGGDTLPEQPTEPSTPPSTDGSDTANSGSKSNPDAGGDTTKPGEPSQPTNPPITDDAVNKDEQGNITITPQPVAPNQTVVGTQNGQLLIQDISGNTRLAEATEFGGQKNDNGTVSFKTADGKTVTLPETGESTVGLIVGLLIILAGLGLGFKDKLKALVDNIKVKSKK